MTPTCSAVSTNLIEEPSISISSEFLRYSSSLDSSGGRYDRIVYLQPDFLQQSFLQRVNVILQGENVILQQGFLQQVFLQNLQNYI